MWNSEVVVGTGCPDLPAEFHDGVGMTADKEARCCPVVFLQASRPPHGPADDGCSGSLSRVKDIDPSRLFCSTTWVVADVFSIAAAFVFPPP